LGGAWQPPQQQQQKQLSTSCSFGNPWPRRCGPESYSLPEASADLYGCQTRVQGLFQSSYQDYQDVNSPPFLPR
jgi:hypothetical protein